VVTGAGDGRRRAAADGSRARAESRDETRTRERVRRAGGERSSEWLGFGGIAASSFIWGGAGGGRGLGRAPAPGIGKEPLEKNRPVPGQRARAAWPTIAEI